MNPEAWKRAKVILGEAIEMPLARREAYVRQACEGDGQLLAEVLALLQADSSETLLHSPLPPQEFQPSQSGTPEADLAGRLIHRRYLIKGALGRGGFAVTYYAVDTQLDARPVVVKVLLDHHAEDPWVLKKFQQEMRALARLDHPGVVGALDSGQLADGRPYLVMQFVKGAPLRQAMNPARGMDLKRTGNILRQAGNALSAAHQEGICHRDVKPENIMLFDPDDGEEQLKLIDFGIASIRETRATGSTEPTRVAGTLTYMAPEQFEGVSSAASDIYSLGVVAYEMVTGRPPVVAESMAQFVGLQLEGVKVKPKDLRPALPEEAQAAILRALAKNPAERFPRARDFGEAFVKGLASSSAVSTAPIAETHDPPHRPAVTHYRLWVWTGALALALAIAAGAWIVRPAARVPEYPSAGKSSIPVRDTTGPQPTLQEGPTSAFKAPVKESPKELTKASIKANVSLGEVPGASAGAVRLNPKDGQRFHWIPPGSFVMGCSAGDIECFDNENPVRNVTIAKGFWMGETEVTQEAFQKVTGQNPSIFKGPKQPVENVSWNDAQAYCQATGTRLPTEAEWEYAARAGSGKSRYGDLAAIAWFGGNSDGKPHEVGRKAANAWGLYDTLGNVWEWMADWYTDKNPASSQTDPIGPVTGQYRSTRGGSWRVDPRSVRVSGRRRDEPGRRGDFTGFRCADAQPLPAVAAPVTTKTQLNPRDGLMYVWIPPGTFSMGCLAGDSECRDDEKPARRVTLTKGFWIGQTEVTREAYQRVTMKDASNKSRLPVDGKTWDESQSYCSAVGLRLPSEAEWEFAARGGSVAARYGDLNAIAWYQANSGNSAHDVAGLQPNSYGLYDMLGNLREWTADWYGADYYRSAPASDPRGPPGGQSRAQRGGAFPGTPNNVRVSARFGSVPNTRDGAFGFRCVGGELPTSVLAAKESGTVAQTKVNPTDGLTYALIPSGTFTMGCSPGDLECEGARETAHQVAITRAFWIGQTEVTQKAFRKVTGTNPSAFKGDDLLPVDSVEWSDAQAYCKAVGMRLPTEAEWEYAARAGTSTVRYGEVNLVAWYDANSNGKTHPVGQKQPNAFGLYDMLGNVYEYVSDWYSDTYYTSSPASDPQGPNAGNYHVVRGGSWNLNARYLRASRRPYHLPGSVPMSLFGLRCVGN